MKNAHVIVLFPVRLMVLALVLAVVGPARTGAEPESREWTVDCVKREVLFYRPASVSAVPPMDRTEPVPQKSKSK